MKRFTLLFSFVALAGCASQQQATRTDTTSTDTPTAVAAKPAPATESSADDAAKKPTFTGATIHFGFNDSTLQTDHMETLRNLAETMRANDVIKVEIAGHADERGTTEYNLALGTRRADAARKYLLALGVPESRVTIISFGEEKPAVEGDTEEAYSANRRNEIAPR